MPAINTNLEDREQSRPLVSVIIPAFNVAEFIADALLSIITQSVTDVEIIVINDGSPDTEALEQNLVPFLSRITYIKQANRGAGAARNAGLNVARGTFVAFLDGDDKWLPNFLELQLKLIESDGGYDFVYCDAINIGDVKSRYTNMEINPSTGSVTAEALISGRCNVVTSSVLARRDVILSTGLFDESFPNSQDYDLWLRLAKAGARMTYQTRVLVERRIYEGSLASDPIKSFTGEIRVLEKTALRSDLTPAERNALQQKIDLRRADIEVCRGKQNLTAGDFSAASTAFRTANDVYQSWKLSAVLFSLQVAPRLLQRVYKLRTT